MAKELANNWIKAVEDEIQGRRVSADGQDARVGILQLILENPDAAADEILKIIDHKPSDRVLNRLGAGPVEELLVANPQYLERLILEASDPLALRKCLQFVNPDEGSELERSLASIQNTASGGA